ncbi:MAG: type III secretion system chaperone [Planctomycetaceae bacterium]
MKRLLVKGCILGMTILCAAPLTAAAFAQQTPARTAQSGQLTQESLGNLVRAMGLRPKLEEKRFDFRFKAILNKAEWELSMSTVLSTNKKSVWVMAWLDELPKSAADVPRTALLRLLADNDRMGKGKFFAYIAGNRRFVLQRVIPNENISTASFRDVLKDLATTVVVTYPHWSVANWKTGSSATAGPSTAGSANRSPNVRPAGKRTTIRDPKFGNTRRN